MNNHVFISLTLPGLFFLFAGYLLYSQYSEVKSNECSINLEDAFDIADFDTHAVPRLWISGAKTQKGCRALKALVSANSEDEFLLHRVSKSGDPEEYPDRLLLDAMDRDAPDIAYVDQKTVSKLARSNALWPVTNCAAAIGTYAMESAIPDHAVTETFQWGIPYDINPIILAYNRGMLSELGWAKNELNSLPSRISQGDFTLDDMTLTGMDAIARNITKRGFAFMPLLSNLTFVALYEAFREPYSEDLTRHDSHDLPAIYKLLYFWKKLSIEKLTHKDFLEHIPSVSRELRKDAIVNGKALFALIEAEEWISIQKSGNPDFPMGITLVPSGLQGHSARSVNPSIGYHVIFKRESTGASSQLKSCSQIAALHASGLAKLSAQQFGLPIISGESVEFPDAWPINSLEQITFPASERPYWQALFLTLSEVAADMIENEYSVDRAVRRVMGKLENSLVSIRYRIRR